MKCDALMALAHEHSPRVEMHGAGLVLLDVDGLGQLWGPPRQIGERLRRAAAERQLGVRVAIAGTKMAALLATQGRCGLTVIQPGDEAKRVSTFPLSVLKPLTSALAESVLMLLPIVQRWGIKTLGALADLPTDELCTRLGPSGVELQRIARGQDSRPLVPEAEDERFEQTLALEWPVEGLEPLAFVLGRVLDPLCGQLDARGVAVGMLHVRLTLVTRETHERALRLHRRQRDLVAVAPDTWSAHRNLTTAQHDFARRMACPVGAPRGLMCIPRPAHGHSILFQHGFEHLQARRDDQLLELGLRIDQDVDQRKVPGRRRLRLAPMDDCARLLHGGSFLGASAPGFSHRPYITTSREPPLQISTASRTSPPVPARTLQFSLLERAVPSAERVSTLLARLTVLMGEERCGSPGLVDTHEPGAFEMRPFVPRSQKGRSVRAVADTEVLVPVLRRFRTPVSARVTVEHGQPVRVSIGQRHLGFSRPGSGQGHVVTCAGPWRTSGQWWGVSHSSSAVAAWDRDEWDVALSNGGLYRIFRDHDSKQWFIDGMVD